MNRDSRQTRRLFLVAALSPAISLLPRLCTRTALGAGWLAGVFSLPFILIMCLFLLKNPGVTLFALFPRAFGKTVGVAVSVLLALWFIFFAGLTLRLGAERFVTTVYAGENAAAFIIIPLLMAALAALGNKRALPRFAEVTAPVIVGTLLLLLVCALFEGDVKNLLPVTGTELLPALKASLYSTSAAAAAVLPCACLGGASENGSAGRTAFLCVFTAALFSALAGVCSARFGAEIASKMTQPMFELSRNTSLFGILSRLEAVMTALWLLPDYVLVSLCLTAASSGARSVLGVGKESRAPVCACVLLAGICAFLLPSERESLGVVTEVIAPWGSVAFALAAVAAKVSAARRGLEKRPDLSDNSRS